MRISSIQASGIEPLMNSHPVGGYARLAQTAAIFIMVSLLSLLLLSKAGPPIAWEDHFQIGQNLRSAGTLTVDGVPSLFRPPGFPGFVAAALWIGDAISSAKGEPSRRSAERDIRTVVHAQGILLGVMAAVLFFWASFRTGPIVAASLATAATLNPYSLAVADIATYHLLFVVLTTFSTLALFFIRGSSMPSGSTALGAGLLWGLTSLVKPIALIIPLFIAPVLMWRLPLRPAVRASALLVLGMILVVAPYVARNDLVTGRAFVTAQGGIVFWGSTVRQMAPDESFLNWESIWWKDGMPIFSRVTGSAKFSDAIQNAYVLPLNDEFAEQARANIIATPQIYFYNVLRNFVSFNLDTMDFWNKFLIAHNRRMVEVLSAVWIVAMMALSAAGVIWGLARNDDDAITVAAVYLCIVVAYSISFSTELYTIAKFPLVVLGFALLLMRLEGTRRHRWLAPGIACTMALVALTISILAA
jgi:hypothetical protein